MPADLSAEFLSARIDAADTEVARVRSGLTRVAAVIAGQDAKAANADVAEALARRLGHPDAAAVYHERAATIRCYTASVRAVMTHIRDPR